LDPSKINSQSHVGELKADTVGWYYQKSIALFDLYTTDRTTQDLYHPNRTIDRINHHLTHRHLVRMLM